MKDLSEKVIIVTGGRGLIGREIVRELKERDAIVISADITEETSATDRTFHLDLGSYESIDSLVKFTLDGFGRIDGLINAAYPHTPDWGRYRFENDPVEHWEENVRLQLNSTFYICRETAKVMERQQFGSIVNLRKRGQ